MKKSRITSLLLSLIMLVAALITLIVPAVAADEVNEYSGFYEKSERDKDTYAYSIAVIGDTQSLSLVDYQNRNDTSYVKRMDTLYSWIQDNIESKKIGLVMGLGDIVENWHNPLDYPEYKDTELGNQSIWEWENAARIFTTYLNGEKGVKVPYTLVRGNHDSANAYNKFIASDAMALFREQYIPSKTEDGAGADSSEPKPVGTDKAGFYVDSWGVTKYDNSYMKLTLGTTKWLVLTLDFGITERELDWAGEVISNNPDYKVILSMHSYLYHDRTIDGEGDTQVTAVPNPNWDSSTDMRADNKTKENPEGPVYNPDGIWERLVSRHSNIELVLSGHIPNGAPQMSQLVGDNGNTVTQILIDPQSMDLPAANSSGCGMVAMLYFNEDGTLAESQWDEKTVDIEWYSTIKKKHYKEGNQFTINLELYAGGSKTENYGIIPAEYADAEKYPFVTFGYDRDIDEYFFLGAHANWMHSDGSGALPSLSAISGAAKKVPAYILLRRDYAMSNLDYNYAMSKLTLSSINLDLGGHKLTTVRNTANNKDVYLLQLNYASGAKSTMNIYGKSGSALITGSSYAPLFNLGTGSGGNGGSFTLNVSGITLAFKDGNTTNAKLLFTTSSMNGTAGALETATVNAYFTDCTFDLSSAKANTDTILMALDEAVSDTNNIHIANVEISGGTIITDKFDELVFFTKNDNDSVLFTPNSKGELTSLSLPTQQTVSGSFDTDIEGSHASFGEGALVSGRYVYTLKRSVLESTPYGNIDATLFPKERYPFVLFRVTGKDSYEFVKAYDTYSAFVTEAASVTTNSVLYMRRDYDTVNDSYSGNADRNLNKLGAPLTLDLGKHVFTRTNVGTTGGTSAFKKHLIQAYGTNGVEIEINIEIKNGKVLADNYLVYFNNHSGQDTSVPAEETFNITFTGVEIIAGTAGNFVNIGGNGNGSFGNLTFNNCTFDLSGAKSSFVPFELNGANSLVEIGAKINGGKIIAGREVALAVMSESGDSLTISGDFALVMPSSVAHPTTGITTTAGTLYATEVADDGTNATYLYKSNITKYGAIDLAYLSEVDFPFALFNKDGWVKSYTYYSAFVTDAAIVTTDSVLYMRRDYDTVNDSYSGNADRNLNKLGAPLTLDLGGHTFTRSNSGSGAFKKHLIQAYGTNGVKIEINIEIMNGKVLADNYLVYFNNHYGQSTSVPAEETFNITFTRVEIIAGTAGNFVNIGSNGNGSYGNLTFNNCTFNLRGAKSGFVPFELNGSNSLVEVGVEINGGKIIAGREVALATLSADGDSLTFGKYEGKYPTVTYPKTAATPTEVYNSTELAFAQLSSDADTVTYGLKPKAIVNFKPQTSITLDSNLILNIYIPENSYLTEITLDGKTYAIGDLTATDGKYRLTVELPAAEAARDVALTVTFGEEGSASYTLSTLKYAEKLLADTGATATTKTLVCNMLAYIKSAYAYFAETDTEKATATEVGNAIDEIIGTGYTAFKKVDGATTNMAVGEGVTFILDAEPRVRFYFAEGTDLTNYAFKIDGVAQEFTVTSETIGETNLVCADISLFAYKMIGTIEVFKDGVSQGTFHINAYYDFALTQSNNALVEVVERFYVYCVSAQKYRDEVIANR